MDLSALIETHGYWMLALGCLLEGETLLVLAGFAAHEGHLNPWAVFGIATVMAMVGDQIYFWLGRWRGPQLLARYPKLHAKAERVQALLERWHAPLIIGLRFAYGLRIAGPLFIGASPLPAWRFIVYNGVGAVIWAAVVGGIGWSFGAAAQALLGELQRYQMALMGALVGLALLVWVWRHRGRGH
ncbi:DedA family protein [Azohydromonas lata]|uniref:DedA family protein n=1 Tax=Azohydromonas lata TaxID=45677 RepID=A0ABU5II95_9BURK|nr:DedA family protein [Azohydromonas lata]MDZ5458779.1 DedA family protein [Azohydromonas lata]